MKKIRAVFARDMSQIVGKCPILQCWIIPRSVLRRGWLPQFNHLHYPKSTSLVKFSPRTDWYLLCDVANKQTNLAMMLYLPEINWLTDWVIDWLIDWLTNKKSISGIFKIGSNSIWQLKQKCRVFLANSVKITRYNGNYTVQVHRSKFTDFVSN